MHPVELGLGCVRHGAALKGILIPFRAHPGRQSGLPPLDFGTGRGRVVLFPLLAKFGKVLQLRRGNGQLMGRNGGADAVEPLLLVEDVVGLERVGLARGWVAEMDSEDVFRWKEGEARLGLRHRSPLSRGHKRTKSCPIPNWTTGPSPSA